MVVNSTSDNTALSGTANEKKNWATSPSTILNHFAIRGLIVAIVTSTTHTLDVLKVRLQMQLVGQKGPLSGLVSSQMHSALKLGSSGYVDPSNVVRLCCCCVAHVDASNITIILRNELAVATVMGL
ncbi:unnamed protein product [Lathyrus sativus]|nr:unnamed protein product [Lathyrus sativus]